MTDTPKIAVLGAGAIGCFVGGTWATTGLDVVLIGRARRAEEAAKGLHLTDYDDWEHTSFPPFTTDPSVMHDADLIVLTVKSTGTEAAAAQIGGHARAETPVLSLQNGVSNPDILRRLLPGRTILHGTVPFNVVSEGPGRWHKATLGHIFADRHPLLHAIHHEAVGTPAELEEVDDMEPIAWGKLLLNLNNAVNALSGLTLREELSQRPYRRVLAAAMRETLELLQVAGIRPAKVGAMAPNLVPTFLSLPDLIFRPVGLRLQKIDPKARSSMADDFAEGRPSEIDMLNGEVVRLAQRLGREAPVNARLVELVRDAEAGGRRDWPARDLASAVLDPPKE